MLAFVFMPLNHCRLSMKSKVIQTGIKQYSSEILSIIPCFKETVLKTVLSTKSPGYSSFP